MSATAGAAAARQGPPAVDLGPLGTLESASGPEQAVLEERRGCGERRSSGHSAQEHPAARRRGASPRTEPSIGSDSRWTLAPDNRKRSSPSDAAPNARPPLAVLMQDAVAGHGHRGRGLNGVGEIESGQTLVLSVSRSDRGGNPAEPAVGRCSLEGADSMAAYALKTASPTVSVNLAQESRFNDPFLRGLGRGVRCTFPCP